MIAARIEALRFRERFDMTAFRTAKSIAIVAFTGITSATVAKTCESIPVQQCGENSTQLACGACANWAGFNSYAVDQFLSEVPIDQMYYKGAYSFSWLWVNRIMGVSLTGYLSSSTTGIYEGWANLLGTTGPNGATPQGLRGIQVNPVNRSSMPATIEVK